METQKQMLPIGIENFEELRSHNYYYVDKTGLIRDLLTNRAKVTLFTRPRRFGKTLNMSMLENFFKLGGDKHLFDGLEISKGTALCDEFMGKYPVIFLSLKDLVFDNYETATCRMARIVREEAMKVDFLKVSTRLSEEDRSDYRALLDLSMSEEVLTSGLKVLSRLLEKHFGSKVILLIDEYDVPVATAHKYNYYEQMVSLIKGLLSTALKSNDSLEFAVLTGCLRVSKESIFTGLNNLDVFSVKDALFSKYFGFTDSEVRELLAYYGIEEVYDNIKEWYDGYQFGYTQMYCPWDVLSYSKRFLGDPKLDPENYWINTSGNDAVRRFVEIADEKL